MQSAKENRHLAEIMEFHADDSGSAVEAALPSFRKAINDPRDGVRLLAIYTLSHLGRHLLTEARQRFEILAQTCPDDLALCIVLISSYRGHRVRSIHTDEALHKHICCVIRNHPGSEFARSPLMRVDAGQDGEVYKQARELWLMHLERYPSNVSVLDNAAHFFAHCEPGLSKRLLETAKRLDPGNPQWYQRMGHLVLRESGGVPLQLRLAKAKEALRELEVALGLITQERKTFSVLADLAKTSFEAAEFEKARAYASELVNKASRDRSFCDRGEALHHGNLVLGRLALRDGDREGAKARLIEAGKVAGTPVLQSFGPNMKLAEELLLVGERNAVIEYLGLCTNFWQSVSHDCQKWIDLIERGGIPYFGPNLYY